MGQISKELVKMKVFQKGQVVIPVSLRKKYEIRIGDQIDIVPKADGILLKPAPKKVASESLTEQLFGVFNTYAVGKSKLTKKDINKAVERGFTGGAIE